MARPKSKFDSVLFTRIHSNTKEALRRIADLRGVDLSVVVRWAIEEYVTKAEGRGDAQ